MGWLGQRKKRYGDVHAYASARELSRAMSRGEIRKSYIGPDMPEIVNAMVQVCLNTTQGRFDALSDHERADYLGKVHETYQMADRLGMDGARQRLDLLMADLKAGKYQYSGDWGANR